CRVRTSVEQFRARQCELPMVTLSTYDFNRSQSAPTIPPSRSVLLPAPDVLTTDGGWFRRRSISRPAVCQNRCPMPNRIRLIVVAVAAVVLAAPAVPQAQPDLVARARAIHD